MTAKRAAARLRAVAAEVASFLLVARRCKVLHGLPAALYGGPVLGTVAVAVIGPAACTAMLPLVDGMIAEALGLATSIGLALFFSLHLLKRTRWLPAANPEQTTESP